jgi:hypothetical protein
MLSPRPKRRSRGVMLSRAGVGDLVAVMQDKVD